MKLLQKAICRTLCPMTTGSYAVLFAIFSVLLCRKKEGEKGENKKDLSLQLPQKPRCDGASSSTSGKTFLTESMENCEESNPGIIKTFTQTQNREREKENPFQKVEKGFCPHLVRKNH